MKTRFLSIGAAFVMAALVSACGGGQSPASGTVIPAAASEPATPAPVSAPAVPAADELDAAVRETSDYLNSQLPSGNKLVILNIQSEYPALSEYIIDELIANTVNDKVFAVVDRQQLDVIRAELDFQMSEEVDDNTAQALGRLAGAQIIVSGAVSRIGDLYRLRVRALGVENARIEGQFNRNIPDGPTVAALVKSQATGYSNYGGTATAARPAASTGASGTAASAPGSVPATPAAAVPAAAASPAAPPAGGAPAETAAAVPDYVIGNTGPAGGVVFYPTALVATPPPVTQEYRVGDTGPAGGIIFYVNPRAGEWKYLEAAPASTEWSGIRWGAYGVDAGGKGAGLGEGKTNTQTIINAMNEIGESVPAVQHCVNLNQGGFRDWFLPSKAELNLMYSNLKLNGLGGFKNEWYWSSTEADSARAWHQTFNDGTQRSEDSYNRKNATYYVRAVRAFN